MRPKLQKSHVKNKILPQNFIFDDMDNEFWNSGALISITLNRNEINTEFIPFCKQKNGNIRLAQEQDKEKIMNDFYERSKEVVDPEFVSKNYAKYAQEKLNQALRVLNGNIARMLPFRILNKLTGNQLIRKFYNEKSRLAVLDYIECEAHREMIIDALKKY